jgi:hypothetical protein
MPQLNLLHISQWLQIVWDKILDILYIHFPTFTYSLSRDLWLKELLHRLRMSIKKNVNRQHIRNIKNAHIFS